MAVVRTPDGQEFSVAVGQTLLEVLPPDRRWLVARTREGELWDLFRPVEREDQEFEVLTFADPQGREVYWHSAAHILAEAVKELFPQARLTIGPPTEEGFYYDFDMGGYTLTPEDLEAIEARMREIVARDEKVFRKVVSKEEARKLFASLGEVYKLEILDEIEGDTVTLYGQGKFVDLCRGPHVPSTGYIGALKVLSASAAYWRGKEGNPVLQRVYGIAFPSQEELEAFLARREEALRRDHRKLGRELELFTFSDEVGAGLPIWLPRGAMIRRVIEDLWRREHDARGYAIVYTPHVGRARLWEISGHLAAYRENMFPPMEMDHDVYFVKPMNCPFHIQIYKTRARSYRDLPLRLAEIGTVYRFERSGVLHGLLRVRGFSQDDAHIFCTPEQAEEEVKGVVTFALDLLRMFGFDTFEISLSTRPEKYVGSLEMWEHATQSLARALEGLGLAYDVDEGGGAFYGPKIDIQLRDALGRRWQLSTVQFDFNLPERFDLTYRGPDGRDHRPYMIHRALFGSFERFLGVLIEHYAGNFPFWLAPTQVVVIPITDGQRDYAHRVARVLQEAGIRVEVDDRNERVGYKIAEAERRKVPVMLVVGKREVAAQRVAVRVHGEGDRGTWDVDGVVEVLREANRPGGTLNVERLEVTKGG